MTPPEEVVRRLSDACVSLARKVHNEISTRLSKDA